MLAQQGRGREGLPCSHSEPIEMWARQFFPRQYADALGSAFPGADVSTVSAPCLSCRSASLQNRCDLCCFVSRPRPPQSEPEPVELAPKQTPGRDECAGPDAAARNKLDLAARWGREIRSASERVHRSAGHSTPLATREKRFHIPHGQPYGPHGHRWREIHQKPESPRGLPA